MKTLPFLKLVRALSLFAISVAMMRFTISREGMMPFWMELVSIHLLDLFRIESFGAENIEDVSFFATLLSYWIVAAAVMFVISRLTRPTARHTGVLLALAICTYAAGNLTAIWINDVVIKPVQFKRDPDDFQFLYLSCVIIASWLGAIAATFALLSTLKKFCPRLLRNV
jgi:hypothetical protein